MGSAAQLALSSFTDFVIFTALHTHNIVTEPAPRSYSIVTVAQDSIRSSSTLDFLKVHSGICFREGVESWCLLLHSLRQLAILQPDEKERETAGVTSRACSRFGRFLKARLWIAMFPTSRCCTTFGYEESGAVRLVWIHVHLDGSPAWSRYVEAAAHADVQATLNKENQR